MTRPALSRTRECHLTVDLEVDRGRDLDQLGADLLDAVHAALVAGDRRGAITHAELDPGSLFEARFYRFDPLAPPQ
jgi:hypothetical protein